MSKVPVTLELLNGMGEERFVGVLGGVFEHSPWIARRTWAGREGRPFGTVGELYGALVETMREATADERMGLIRAHPDLVGRLAKEGGLTRESTGEQAAAGLGALSEEEVGLFDRYNGEYQGRFGFPFIICARENKKAAILAAFPVRLRNSREAEVETALAEIAKIAKFRLMDAVVDSAG